MLFKRFILLTCIMAAGGIFVANLIQATHPSRSIATASNRCAVQSIYCMQSNAKYAQYTRAS